MAEQELIVHIGADIQAFQSAMNNVQSSMQNTAGQVESAMNGAEAGVTGGTSRISSALKGIAGLMAGAFALDKLKDFGVSAIEAGAESQAMEAQFSQVFGDISSEAQTTIDGLGKQFGMVPKRIQPAMTQMTSMFKGLGMDTATAMSTAESAVTVVADSAAFYDKSFEDANSALNSFIKGNYEGGESIGLFANETQLASFASEKLGVDWKTLNEAGKQTARLEFAKQMQESAGATGQASRESDSYTNQLGNLQSVWTTLKAQLATPFLEPLIGGLKNMAEWLGKVDVGKIHQTMSTFGGYLKDVLTPTFNDVKDGLQFLWDKFKEAGGVETAKQAFEGFKDVLSWIKDNTEVITAVLGGLVGAFVTFQIITGINTAIGIFNTLITAMRTGTLMATLAQWGLNTALLANPFVWIAVAVGALIAIVILLWKNWDTVSVFLTDSWTWISEMASSIWGGITDFFKKWGMTILIVLSGPIGWLVAFIVKNWEAISEGAKKIFNGIMNFLSGIWTSIKETASSKWNDFKTTISNIWEGVKTTIANKIENIKEKITGIWTKAKEIAGNIKGAFTNIFTGIKMPTFTVKGSLNPKNWLSQGLPKLGINWHKEGGIFNNPSVIGIGEAGSEAVIPLNNKAHVRPFAQAVASLMPQTSNAGIDGNLNLTINVPLELDGREVARATVLFNQEELDKLQKKQHRLMGRYA